jgi:hypothetical protein
MANFTQIFTDGVPILAVVFPFLRQSASYSRTSA